MRKSLAIVAVAVAALAIQSFRVEAVGPDFNLRAMTYSANLVQAMDQCSSAVTNVGGVGACPQSNANTSGTHFTVGRVVIKSMASRNQVATSLKSSRATPPGALGNKSVHTQIVLRITRTNGSPLVTWVDQTVNCPNFVVPASGDAVQKLSLVDCGLAAMLADNTTNKEVVSVKVIDNASSNPLAVPGVRRVR